MPLLGKLLPVPLLGELIMPLLGKLTMPLLGKLTMALLALLTTSALVASVSWLLAIGLLVKLRLRGVGWLLARS